MNLNLREVLVQEFFQVAMIVIPCLNSTNMHSCIGADYILLWVREKLACGLLEIKSFVGFFYFPWVGKDLAVSIIADSHKMSCIAEFK